MTRLRDARGRLAAALLLAGSIAVLAACHTVGGTVSGMGEDIGATGKFLTGGPQQPQAAPQAAAPASPQAATPGVTQPGAANY